MRLRDSLLVYWELLDVRAREILLLQGILRLPHTRARYIACDTFLRLLRAFPYDPAGPHSPLGWHRLTLAFTDALLDAPQNLEFHLTCHLASLLDAMDEPHLDPHPPPSF